MTPAAPRGPGGADLSKVVMAAVEEMTRVDERGVLSIGRPSNLVRARKLAAWGLVRLAEYSYAEAARRMLRDHTTVMYLVEWVDESVRLERESWTRDVARLTAEYERRVGAIARSVPEPSVLAAAARNPELAARYGLAGVPV